ncbi:hypothetical protein R4P47_01525 [Rhodococcus sp. IEGM 1370]|uniref:hypothetical protein n=1 Tax=Rhodococcus sp. IEGM 1370 TaxID=3082222 RepID=UPI002954A90D|nr:hypothetical protein [Rhodococcus sp. IEGM 1370]MDV8075221.1 hypothetical protein [Rhodococcus sp. IEGM 1370]
MAKPYADPQLVELSNGFNDWKSTQELPKVPLPNYSALVHALSPTMGRREYQQLSGIAHASAVTLSSVFLLAQMGHEKRIEDSWRHALFATQCGVLAAANVCYIRDGDKTAINSCLAAFLHYERKYNQYLWDLSTERGFDPGEPRP